MNDEQKNVYQTLVEGKNIFITGSGGVGKSYIIKKFIDEFKCKKKVAVTSTTGVSAVLIGGTTLHSYLGIGLGEGNPEYLINKIRKNKVALDRWKTVQTLIIDEVSMLKPELFDNLEKVAKIIRRSIFPFGGIQIVLSGDFLQLPCIKSEKFLFEAECWNKVISNENVFYLQKIVRQKDELFCKILEKIKYGNIDSDVKETLSKRIKIKIEDKEGIKPTKLYCRNIDVEKENEKHLKILSEKHGILMEYPTEFKFAKDIKYEKMVKIRRNINIPDKIYLCNECQVMLTYNLDIQNELVNGSRGIITSFNDEGYPKVKFLNGLELEIEPIQIEVKDNDILSCSYSYLPLKLGFATSIHKSQGSTIDLLEVDLGDIFEYGQGYVALSRVKELDGLSIKKIDWDGILAHPKALEFYQKLI
jgi:ATP-dependent DNA helicase PIF1